MQRFIFFMNSIHIWLYCVWCGVVLVDELKLFSACGKAHRNDVLFELNRTANIDRHQFDFVKFYSKIDTHTYTLKHIKCTTCFGCKETSNPVAHQEFALIPSTHLCHPVCSFTCLRGMLVIFHDKILHFDQMVLFHAIRTIHIPHSTTA